MSNIFASDFGGMRIKPSAVSEANLIKGQASISAKEDKAFAEKLKEVQMRAENMVSKNAKSPEEDKKLREACREMESVFLNIMLGKMRDTVPERTLFKKSSGEKMMQSMLDIELTRQMAQGGGIGLGELLYKQLSNPGTKKIPDDYVPGPAVKEEKRADT